MSDIDPRAHERTFYDDTDYADVDVAPAEDVTVVRRPGPRSTFALRLDGETIDQLRRVADRRGERPTQLARRWLVERLADEARPPSTVPPAVAAWTSIDATSASDIATAVGALRDAVAAFGQSTDDAGLATRVAALERRVFAGEGAWAMLDTPIDRGTDDEPRLVVLREVTRRVRTASVSLPAHRGPDLLVRADDGREWAIGFAGADDPAPEQDRLLAAAALSGATPVLVAPRLPLSEATELLAAEGLVVTTAEQFDHLLVAMGAGAA